MSEPFLGEIKIFGGNFAPKTFALCDGQLLAISQNTALFSLLGTNFGGDGRVTFALPDFRGRVPMHAGNGPGLTPRVVGELAGTENVTLLASEMPAHTHAANCTTAKGSASTPVNNFWAKDKSGLSAAYSTTQDGSLMSPAAVSSAGGSLPHNNVQPCLVLNFIIALFGIFPSRG